MHQILICIEPLVAGLNLMLLIGVQRHYLEDLSLELNWKKTIKYATMTKR